MEIVMSDLQHLHTVSLDGVLEKMTGRFVTTVFPNRWKNLPVSQRAYRENHTGRKSKCSRT